jgi:hypothetical protein
MAAGGHTDRSDEGGVSFKQFAELIRFCLTQAFGEWAAAV